MDEIRDDAYPYRLKDGDIVDAKGRRWTVPGNLGIAQLLNTICEHRKELRALRSETETSDTSEKRVTGGDISLQSAARLTPRTDDVVRPGEYGQDYEIVNAEFARQLERELNALRSSARLTDDDKQDPSRRDHAREASGERTFQKLHAQAEADVMTWAKRALAAEDKLAALQSATEAPCATCNGDPAVCATVPGLRHCEAANRKVFTKADCEAMCQLAVEAYKRSTLKLHPPVPPKHHPRG